MKTFLLPLMAMALFTLGGHATASPSSPESGRIAFPTAFGNRLVTMNPDGTGVAVLSYSHDVSPAWSPDGSQLAVSSLDSGNGDILVLSPDGRQRKQLTSSDDPENDPAWAPCGCVIAYDRMHDGDTAVYALSPNGGESHLLADAEGCDEDPAFSPDGTKIAFASCRSGSAQIYVMNADGSHVTRLTHDDGDDRNPVWSPSGTQIAFDGWREYSRQIYTIDADGTGESAVSPGPSDVHPTWSAEGRSLAYDASASDGTVTVMSLAGPEQHSIAVGGGSPSWQATETTESDCTDNGTPGNDVLIGGPGHDILCGSSGDDRITGGPGSDLLRGGDGNDVLDARDGTQDVVVGGPGFDTAFVDHFDIVVGVEDVRYVEPRNLARGRPVTASYSWADSAPSFAVDGQGATGLWWGSYYAPQWIEVDLGQPSTIRRIELTVAQNPPGQTVHIVSGRDTKGKLHQLRVIARETADNDVLVLKPKQPWHGITAVRVTTVLSPSWVAWKEIRVLR
jgi:dipeptidyl aminopeptidase/acylaminoacyl peptidase